MDHIIKELFHFQFVYAVQSQKSSATINSKYRVKFNLTFWTISKGISYKHFSHTSYRLYDENVITEVYDMEIYFRWPSLLTMLWNVMWYLDTLTHTKSCNSRSTNTNRTSISQLASQNFLEIHQIQITAAAAYILYS